MTGDSPTAAVAALRSRHDVLEAIRSTPREKPALRERLGVSRSTVDRAVDELESAGLVTRTDEGYAPTLYGEVLADRYALFRRAVGDVADARPLLETLPPDVPMSHAVFRGATVHCSTAPVPHRPIDRFEALLADADRLRALSRTIAQSTTPRLVRERVVEAGMNAELVVSSSLASYMHTRRRAPEREMIETGRYRLFEVESVPYGLALLSVDGRTHVVVFVYGDADDLLGTVVNDADEAVSWAEDLYRRYRNRAEDVSDRFLEGAG